MGFNSAFKGLMHLCVNVNAVVGYDSVPFGELHTARCHAPHNSVIRSLYIKDKLVSIQAMKVWWEWRCTATYLATAT